MDYAKLLTGLIDEMREGLQYKRFSTPVKVLAFIGTLPLILSFILSTVFYGIILFFHKALSAPVAYLQSWLKGQKDDIHHATQAVLYFVCMPFIFFLQVLLSINALMFFVVWFFMMLDGYLLTFGGIRWQPFISDATYGDSQDTYECKPDATVASTLIGCIFGVFVLWIIGTVVSFFIDDFNTYQIITDFVRIVWLVYLALVVIVNPIVFRKVKTTSPHTSIDN